MPVLLTPRRVMAARILAVAVDLVQYAFLPFELTPVNNAVDVATAVAMIWLVGWHWAFLPTFLAEMVPFVDLIPTWTVAVMIATRGQGQGEPPIPGGPAGGAPPSLPPAGQSGGASGS